MSGCRGAGVDGGRSALGRGDGVVASFGRQLRAVSLADVLGLALRRQLGTGLFGIGFEYLIDFLAAIHFLGPGW